MSTEHEPQTEPLTESLTDDAIRVRVEQLLAEMTPAEKAGQLTQ